MRPKPLDGVYGRPPAELASVPPDAIQLSPLVPLSRALEGEGDDTFGSLTMLAPAGVLERRYAVAHALRILAPAGKLRVLAPKDKGGARLARELADFGCTISESARRHHRICSAVRPVQPVGLAEAIAAGGAQVPAALGLWSQPGIFSWDRPDPGSLALIRHLPPLVGAGADFGCGIGLLARAILAGQDVTALTLIDIDRRAVAASRRNVEDARATFVWDDIRRTELPLRNLDFVVMNPPFHDGGLEDRALGVAFIARAAGALRPGGVCWLVANRHLPYEAALRSHFAVARQVEQGDGYKIYEARR
ncbi:MAG TPA: methyltransferase [Alphaproteobacteria bacterium]|nr:methyltransferase [Alphaproteobacteria bacterium]